MSRLSLKFLIRDTVFYGSLMVFGKLSSLLAIPILARVFSVGDFGIVDSLRLLIETLSLIALFGVNQGVGRHIFEKDNLTDKRVLAGDGLKLIGFFCLALVFLTFISKDQILRFYVGDYQINNRLFWFITLSFPLNAVINYFYSLLKWHFDRLGYAVLVVISTLLNYLLSILYLVYVETSIEALFCVQLFVFALALLIGSLFCSKYLSVRQAFSQAKAILKFCYPLAIISITTSLLPSIDRYFISNHLEVFYLGAFAMGLKIATLTRFVSTAFNTAWSPFIYNLYGKQGFISTYSKVYLAYSCLLMLMVMFLSFFRLEIRDFIATEEYSELNLIMIPLMLGILFESLMDVTSIGIALTKKTQYELIFYGISILVTLVLNQLGVRHYGIYGIVMAFAAVKFINLLIRNYYSNKFISLRLNYSRIAPLLLLGLGFIGAEAYLDLSIVIKLLLLAFFAAISYGVFNALIKGRYLLIKPVSSV